MIGEANSQLRGWGNYFKYGYPHKAIRKFNSFLELNLIAHLKRLNQCPFELKREGRYTTDESGVGGFVTAIIAQLTANAQGMSFRVSPVWETPCWVNEGGSVRDAWHTVKEPRQETLKPV